jgi:hypothetical protein
MQQRLGVASQRPTSALDVDATAGRRYQRPKDDLQWKMSSLNDISMARMCEGLQPVVRY